MTKVLHGGKVCILIVFNFLLPLDLTVTTRRSVIFFSFPCWDTLLCVLTALQLQEGQSWLLFN